MPRNEKHELQIVPTQQEAARQRFVLALKQDIGGRLRPQLRQVIPSEIMDQQDSNAIANILEKSTPRKIWGRLARTAQELMWQGVKDPLLRTEKDLIKKCTALKEKPIAGGSLELDENLIIPEAMVKVPVHLQPGGYCLDRHQQDILAGALYEAGGALFSQGQSINIDESKAELVVRFLHQKLPHFRPSHILDMACSAGGSSTPYARLFPRADVHAIDIAPGLLRYAHARAESIGVAVHFHQRDVCAPGFNDNNFDLVVSHNAMHEMSPTTIKAMMKESYRLLRPGGVAVHQDVPLRNAELNAFAQADYAWDYLYNNEPYWNSFAELNLSSTMQDAGFEKTVQFDRVPQLGGSMDWDLFWAIKKMET